MALLLTPEQVRAMIREEIERALGELAPGHLTTDQAAGVAGVSPKTIRAWISDGRLQASRRGRLRIVSRVDLDRLLAGGPSGDAAAVVASLRRNG